jgi:predicted HicB family RNase H-like nuclease
VVDRREQRKLDQAQGLVPFAVKLNSELVQQLQTLAKERGTDLNALVAEVLTKGLAA